MKILLVRLRLIGDVVFTTPLLRALRRTYPDAELTYVVEPAAAPIVLHNPHLTRVMVLPKRRGAARLVDDMRVANSLRAARFDVAIDLHGGPRSSWLTWASRAPMRIGYDIPGRAWMYTHVVHRATALLPRNSVLNQWDLLAPLGIDQSDASTTPVEIADDPDAAADVDSRLRDKGVDAASDLVIVHVSSNNPFRCWPEESFASLIVGLVREDVTRRVIVVSGPSDPDAATRIRERAAQQLGALAPALVDLGNPELPALRALIARAAVYIGGDSGPLHVAATTTVPIVAVLGPTLIERSRPWRHPRWFTEMVDSGPLACRPCDQRVCAPGDFRCLTGIGVDRVLAAAERALRHVDGPQGRSESNLRGDRLVHQ